MNIYKKYEAIIFYIVLFGLILSFSFYFNNIDIDFWARLLQGEAFISLGHVLTKDIFSYIPTNQWIDHEWGSGVIFYYILQHFGYSFIVILKSVLVFFIAFFMIKTINLQENKTTKLYNILYFYFVIIQALHTVIKSGIRCQVFTFFFFALFIYILELVRKRNCNKLLFLLPCIMIFWSNIHGGCVSGIGLILIYAVGEIFNKKPCKKYFITLIFVLLALLINPYGFDYLKYLIMATTMPRPMIEEWHSAFFDRSFSSFLRFKIFFSIYILTAIYVFLKKINLKKSIDYTVLILVLIVTLLAVFYIKHLSLFVIVFATFLYYDVYSLFNKLINKIKLIFKISSETFINRFVFVKELLVYTYLILVILAISISTVNFKPRVQYDTYPVKTVEFININDLKGTLLAPFGSSSYICYKLFPSILIYEDGRFEEVYYPISMTLLINFYAQGDLTIFEYYVKPDYILIKKQDVNANKMITQKDYTNIYKDGDNILFCKKELLKKKYIEPTNDTGYYQKTIFDKQFTFKKKAIN